MMVSTPEDKWQQEKGRAEPGPGEPHVRCFSQALLYATETATHVRENVRYEISHISRHHAVSRHHRFNLQRIIISSNAVTTTED